MLRKTEHQAQGTGGQQGVDPFAHLPRCGARAKSTGKPCRRVRGRINGRCWFHGGAPGTGAPVGNTNALKHGFYSRTAIEERREFGEYLKQAKATLLDSQDQLDC